MPAGVTFLLPVGLIDELADATPKALAGIYLTPSGETAVVDGVDAHIATRGLIDIVLASLPEELIAARFGAIGGAKTGSLKRATSAANGKKGGRPKKEILQEDVVDPVGQTMDTVK